MVIRCPIRPRWILGKHVWVLGLGISTFILILKIGQYLSWQVYAGILVSPRRLLLSSLLVKVLLMRGHAFLNRQNLRAHNQMLQLLPVLRVDLQVARVSVIYIVGSRKDGLLKHLDLMDKFSHHALGQVHADLQWGRPIAHILVHFCEDDIGAVLGMLSLDVLDLNLQGVHDFGYVDFLGDDEGHVYCLGCLLSLLHVSWLLLVALALYWKFEFCVPCLHLLLFVDLLENFLIYISTGRLSLAFLIFGKISNGVLIPVGVVLLLFLDSLLFDRWSIHLIWVIKISDFRPFISSEWCVQITQ